MTDNLLVKDKDTVVPGQTMAQGMAFIPSLGTFREGDDIVAGRIGLASVEGKVLKIVPLAGPYLPKLGDVVVGYVEDVLLSGWRLNLGCAYSAVLGLKDATADFIPRGVDLTQYFALGDIVFGKLINVTSQRLIDVTLRGQGLRKLPPGKLVHVCAVKVPRIIGKDGTMVQAVMEMTRTEIIVGQNGVVWIKGDPAMEVLAADAIKFIEANAHKSGLTQTARKYIEDKLGGWSLMAYTKRFDGRAIEDTRPITAKVGVVPVADGSAMFQIGATTAIAAVYGPREMHPKWMQNPGGGMLRCHYNMMPFSGHGDRVRPGQNRRAKEISRVMEAALAPVVNLADFPNAVVDVFIELPQTDAGTRCAGITAAAMALADAGIEMRDMPAAIAVGFVDDRVVADLNYNEEHYNEYSDIEDKHRPVADIPVCVLPRSGEVTLLQLDGNVRREHLKDALHMAQKVCRKINKIQQDALRAKYQE